MLRALDERIETLQEAILAAASVTLVAESGDDVLVPGQSFWVRVKLWNGGPFELETTPSQLAVPGGWIRFRPFSTANSLIGSTGLPSLSGAQ